MVLALPVYHVMKLPVSFGAFHLDKLGLMSWKQRRSRKRDRRKSQKKKKGRKEEREEEMEGRGGREEKKEVS